MKKRLLSIYLLLLAFPNLYAQDIFIAVYAGEVRFSDNRLLDKNFRYDIFKGDAVKFDKESISIIFTLVPFQYIEVKNVDAELKYGGIVEKLKQKMAQKKNNYSEYLSSLKVFSRLQESSKGAVPGAVRAMDDIGNRRIDKKEEIIFPVDSAKLLTNSVHLSWQTGKQIFGSRLIVVDQQTHDTIYNNVAPGGGSIDIPVEKEGIYNWFIYSSLENKKNINRVFIKPGVAERKTISDILEDFKKDIAPLDKELQELILQDYLYQKGILEN